MELTSFYKFWAEIWFWVNIDVKFTSSYWFLILFIPILCIFKRFELKLWKFELFLDQNFDIWTVLNNFSTPKTHFYWSWKCFTQLSDLKKLNFDLFLIFHIRFRSQKFIYWHFPSAPNSKNSFPAKFKSIQSRAQFPERWTNSVVPKNCYFSLQTNNYLFGLKLRFVRFLFVQLFLWDISALFCRLKWEFDCLGFWLKMIRGV